MRAGFSGRLRRRRSRSIALVAATSEAAVGAIPSADGTVEGCYATSTGLLLGIPFSKGGHVRIVDPGEACRCCEQAITWTQPGAR